MKESDTLDFLLGGRGGKYDRMVGSFENLSMCPPPNPCHFFSGKPCTHILNLVLPRWFSFWNVSIE